MTRSATPRTSSYPAYPPWEGYSGARRARRDTGTAGYKSTPKRSRLPNGDACIFALVSLALWFLASLMTTAYWIPSPWQTLIALLRGLDGRLVMHVGYTLLAALLGLLVGFLPGMVLPIWCWHRPMVLAILEPYVAGAYGMPKVALTPIFMLWFGLGITYIYT